jgi:hypothetical protein
MSAVSIMQHFLERKKYMNMQILLSKDTHADPDDFWSDLKEIVLVEICSNKYTQELKSKAAEILKVYMAFTHKKVDLVSFNKARIRILSQTYGSNQTCPDSDPQHCMPYLT